MRPVMVNVPKFCSSRSTPVEVANADGNAIAQVRPWCPINARGVIYERAPDLPGAFLLSSTGSGFASQLHQAYTQFKHKGGSYTLRLRRTCPNMTDSGVTSRCLLFSAPNR